MKRPCYRLESVLEDGSRTEPEIYALTEVKGEWRLSRREFAVTAAMFAALWAGLFKGRASADETGGVFSYEMDVLRSHTDAVRSVAFNKSGKWLASGSGDEKIKIWEVASKALLKNIDNKMPVATLAFSPDGRYLAAGGSTSIGKPGLKIYDVHTGEIYKNLAGSSNETEVLAWDAEGKTLAAGSKDKLIRIWELKGGINPRVLKGHRGEVTALTYTPEGRHIVTGSADKSVKIWDARTGRVIKTLEGHIDQVKGVVVSPDGKTIASGGADQYVLFWERQGGDLVRKAYMGSKIQCLAFSPNGMILLAGSMDKGLYILEGTTGYELGVLKGHTGPLHSVAFSPLDILAASGSADKSVRLWNAASGEMISVFYDPAATERGNSGASYQSTDINGQTVTRVLACGAPMPAGVVCSCNCIPGTYVPSIPLTPFSGSCGVVCQCNKICTCIPVV